MSKVRTIFLVVATALIPLGALRAQAPAKRPLDHDAYAIWDTIGGGAISNDGAWALYSLIGYDRDGELRVRATGAATEHRIPRATGARFDAGTRAALFLIKPAREAARPAQNQGQNARRATPSDTLGILDLRTGRITRIPAVRSFQTPEQGGGWVAYLLERAVGRTGGGESAPASGNAAGASAQRRGGEGRGAATRQGAGESGANTPGAPLVLRNLETGAEHRFENVTSYTLSDDGRRLAYIASASGEGSNGVFVVDVASGTATSVLTGPGSYRSLAWDDRAEQLAFLTTRDDAAEKKSLQSLYAWRTGERAARLIATTGTRGLPDGWQVSEYGSVRFSPDGRRLFFGTAPSPTPAPADSADAVEVKVDIWHWRDPQIQPQQLARVGQERRRNFLAVAHLRENRVVQLADESLPQVSVGARGDADLAVASSSEPYAIENNWDTPGYSDDYVVDVKTGRRTLVREKTRGRISLSPEARYLTWFDNETGWMAREVKSGKIVAMSAGIPYPLENENEDRPQTPSPYGSAGWTPGDAEFLVYDRYDLWALDPSGKAAPRNVTQGAGRRDNIRFRLVRFDRRQETLDPSETLLLSAFQLRTKEDGFYRTTLRGSAEPERLIFMDRAFSTPRKAEGADVVLYTRSSFQEFPDLWVAGTDFKAPRQISNANPQQQEYLWGSAELVEWTSAEGIPLQGVLYKPENFDPSKKYPLVAYFYERMSDGLHAHYAPVPHRSRINFTFYASRGYLVFVPDIVYRTGYPGESAMHAVVPGVLKLLERGYVDRDRLALQGHSWGGYQIAYMVTRTDMFRAAIAGAPVANMTSAYGGIRWESGVSRQFQYERTQSRIGQNLWEAPIRYIENSPLFWLDRVDTPLLIMHNDQDGAVPWYQGIELFMGLRRLQKPTWMINYNGEPHWPTTAANKVDWNIRMQQFFDHYLLDAPAPVWLRDGVPAVEKGRTLGREAAKAGVASGIENRK